MGSGDALEDILDAWQSAFDAGRDVPAADLCRDRPELLPEAERRVAALRQMAGLKRRPDPDATAAHSDPAVTVAAAAPAPGPPAPPGFTIERELGRGGMGVVYLARQHGLNRPAALKMILAGPYAAPAARARFLLEAESIAAVRHPGVVQVFAFGEHAGHPYLAMEFLSGGTLADRVLRSGPLPPPEAAGLAADLADAVAAAHAAGVIHRDLKPGNVLLTEAGEPRVTDFGLAKVGRGDLTATGAVLGTPSYMAPEQAAGKAREAGAAADVYGVGAILYDLLTGRPPFLGDSHLATIQLVLTADPARPRGLNPAVPLDLETVCLRCLEKGPHRRYRTAAALAEDLRRFLAGEPVAARPVGRAERGWRWCRRNPVLAAATGAVAAGLVLAGVMAWFAVANARRAEAQATRLADEERDRLWASLGEQARAERRAGNRRRALDLYRQVVSLKADPGLRPEVIEAIASPGVERIAEVPYKVVRSIQFSPDRTLVVVSADHATEVVVTPTGPTSASAAARRVVEVREVATGRLIGRRFDCWGAGFHPGGRQVLVTDGWHQADGKTATLWDYVANAAAGSFPWGALGWVFSPDGKYLVLRDQERVRIWDLASHGEAAHPPGPALYHVDRSGNLAAGANPPPVVLPYGMRPVEEFPAGRALVETPGTPAAPARLGLWDVAAGKGLGILPVEFGVPVWKRSSPDGRLLVFRDPRDRSVLRVWDWSANRLRGQWAAADPRSAAYIGVEPMMLPNTSLVAATGSYAGRGVLRVWDAETLALLLALPEAGAHAGFGSGADGTHVLVTSGPSPSDDSAPGSPVGGVTLDGERYTMRPTHVQFWEFTRPTPAYRLDAAPGTVSFAAGGKRVATDDTLWDIDQRSGGTELRRRLVHQRGFRLAPGPGDRVWATAPSANAPPHPSPAVQSLEPFDPEPRDWELPACDYTTLEAAAREQRRDFDKGEYTGRISFPASTHVVSPDGTRMLRRIDCKMAGDAHFASGVMVELWDLEARTRLRQWNAGRPGEKYLLGFGSTFGEHLRVSPDSRYGLAVLGAVVRLLDLTTGGVYAEFHSGRGQAAPTSSPQGATVRDTAFSPDGRHLAVWAEQAGDKRWVVTLYGVEARRVVRAWEPDPASWGVVAVAPGGAVVASGGRDRMIHLWDVGTGRELARWPAHDGPLTTLAFNPDGSTLYSGGRDGTLKLWNLPLIRAGLAALGLGW